MGLASQSSRNDRTSGAQRSRMLPRTMFAAAATMVAFGGAYQLLRSDSGSGDAIAAPSSAAAESVTLAMSEAISVEAGRSALDQALDIVTAPREESQETPMQEAKPQQPGATPESAPPPQAPEPDQPASPPKPSFGNGFGDAKPADAATPDAATPDAAAATPDGELREGLALAASEPVKARLLLSRALLSGALGPAESRQASDALQRLSAQLFLTPVFNVNDPACFQYTVQPNDSLEKIVRKQKLGCDWRLVARMNNIKRPEAIAVGKRLKLPRGPFSAVVSKRDYRIDLCAGLGSDRIVVASLPVGLGAANGTPEGRFRVKPGSKLINPEWIHPVTGQRYEADDPANPIGEHWLGLEGIEGKNASLLGYGIHGTIENDSIGQNMSLGCVRLLKDDVALVWESLADGAEVEIRTP